MEYTLFSIFTIAVLLVDRFKFQSLLLCAKSTYLPVNIYIFGDVILNLSLSFYIEWKHNAESGKYKRCVAVTYLTGMGVFSRKVCEHYTWAMEFCL